MFDRQITPFTRLFLRTSLAGLPIALPQGLLKGIDYGHRNSSACMGSPARGILSRSIALPRAQFSFGADFFFVRGRLRAAVGEVCVGILTPRYSLVSEPNHVPTCPTTQAGMFGCGVDQLHDLCVQLRFQDLPITDDRQPTTNDTGRRPGINTKSLPGGASPGRPRVILGPCEVSSRRRLVFLFLLRSLFLGCHEVFSSVNFFPCKVVFGLGACPLFPM